VGKGVSATYQQYCNTVGWQLNPGVAEMVQCLSWSAAILDHKYSGYMLKKLQGTD